MIKIGQVYKIGSSYCEVVFYKKIPNEYVVVTIYNDRYGGSNTFLAENLKIEAEVKDLPKWWRKLKGIETRKRPYTTEEFLKKGFKYITDKEAYRTIYLVATIDQHSIGTILDSFTWSNCYTFGKRFSVDGVNWEPAYIED